METFGPEERRDGEHRRDVQRVAQTHRQIVGAEELTFRAEIMRGGDPIDIQLTGTDPKELLAMSSKIKDQLSTYPALFDINDSLDSGRNEIQLTLKPEAQQFGVTVTDLARQVRQSFYGDEVQRIQRGRNEVKVMLRCRKLTDKTSPRWTPCACAPRSGSGGAIWPRGEGHRRTKSFTSIKRVDRRRALNITADADKATTDVAAMRLELSSFLDDLLANHGHIRWSFEGEARFQRESQGQMLISFLLVHRRHVCHDGHPVQKLHAALHRTARRAFWSRRRCHRASLPRPAGLSIMSAFGILGVCGVVVNDTLVLVDEINDLKANGMSLREAVQRGGIMRFRAIFLTQITTFFGLVPLIFDGTWLAKLLPFLFSSGAQSTHAQFLTPVSVAMGYGSLFATVITLFLVPLCYLAVEDVGRLLRSLFGKEPESPSTLSEPLVAS
jgi:multidrug efflux pump subunit AcrB